MGMAFREDLFTVRSPRTSMADSITPSQPEPPTADSDFPAAAASSALIRSTPAAHTTKRKQHAHRTHAAIDTSSTGKRFVLRAFHCVVSSSPLCCRRKFVSKSSMCSHDASSGSPRTIAYRFRSLFWPQPTHSQPCRRQRRQLSCASGCGCSTAATAATAGSRVQLHGSA